MCKCAKFGAPSRNRLFLSLLFLVAFPLCRTVLVNRTIDSNLGDPVTGFMPIYQPGGSWEDQTCLGCWIQPDISKAFDGTWEAITYTPELQNVNITLHFTGVAIWVFFILANANDHGHDTTSNTQVNITLDGQYVGNFSHEPDMTTHDLWYNQTIYSTTGLANTSHELVISAEDYPIHTFLNFDWAMYTVDIPAPQNTSSSSSSTSNSPGSSSSSSSTSNSPGSSSNIGVIVGCTLGGLAAIALLLIFLYLYRRRTSVQNKAAAKILNIDVTPCQLTYDEPHTRQRHSSGSDFPISPYTQFPDSGSYMARPRETRQTKLNDRIQSPQHDTAGFKAVRNVRSTDEVGGPSTAIPSHPRQEIASLLNEVQQLRDQIGYLHARQEPDQAQGGSGEPLPPAYTQQ